MSWLADSTANKYVKTYFNGFVDVSGGDIIQRNGNFNLTGNIILNGSSGFNKNGFDLSVPTLTANDSLVIQSSFNLKANLASPTFTGVPLAPTAVNGTNTTQLATCAFVLANGEGSGVNTATQTALNLKANLASPTFTGVPLAPTAIVGTNTTQVATTAFVLANAGGSGVNTDTQTALNLKANLASPTFTGTVAGITKNMVGLTNVENTTDLSKPVSTATQTALNLKANLVSPTFTGVLTTSQLAVISGNIALGTSASAAYYASIAIGLSATTGENSSIAIGNSSSTAATDTVALGRLASAVGQFSSAIGKSSSSKGTSSIAIGNTAFVDIGGSNSIAIGSSATTSTYSNSVAIGSNTVSTANNQITLGTATETVRILGTISNSGLTSELNLKANIDNPTFTGIPLAPTAIVGTNTTQVATTAFVLANAGGSGVNTATQTALNLKANLASPSFIGIPVAPTASAGTNTSQVATTAFVLANTSSSSNGFTTLLDSGEFFISPKNPQNGNPKQVVMISNSTLLSNSKSILFYARNVVNYGNLYLLFEINGVFTALATNATSSFTDSNSIFVSTGQLNIVGYRYNTNVIRITRLTNTSRYTYETRVAGTGTVNAFGSFDLSGQITGIKVIQANYSSYMGLQPILGTYHLECTS